MVANIRLLHHKSPQVSLSESFLNQLQRLPKTRPLGEFAPGASGVFLRHDVDHDLDLALEMAFWEREAGHRSTYFILPTAEYATDPRLLLKLRQMQDFGHELGVHLNFLAAWARGEIASVADDAAALLARWRAAGLNIAGCAAHGDRACYEFGFINYWMFRELRPADPAASESGLSPEGVPDPDPARAIPYPASHQLRRADGATFALWSASLEALGLRYHATHLPMDRYYSDSGGRWQRTRSPFEADLTRGSHQVLMHPEYYRGEPKRVFVLSTARAGSKWLATVAGAATPCHALHEFTLNHVFDAQGGVVAEKRTHAGFTALQGDADAAGRLLLEARKYVDALEQDFLECNVYLAHFLPQLRLLFPEATLVELHRDPKAVVRSLLNRDWYDTPEDDRHPVLDDPRWAGATQLERACLYVRGTRELIARFAERRAALEELSASREALKDFFAALGIAFYPLLAQEVFATRVNANVSAAVGPYDTWSAADKATFDQLCAAQGSPPARTLRQRARTLYRLGRPSLLPRLAPWHVQLERTRGALSVTGSRERNGRILVGGGHWQKLRPWLHGWRNRPSSYLKVTCRAEVPAGELVVFGLSYDAQGRLLHAKRISRMSPSLPQSSGTFRASDPRCRWINVALYFPKSADAERRYRIDQLKAERISLSLSE